MFCPKWKFDQIFFPTESCNKKNLMQYTQQKGERQRRFESLREALILPSYALKITSKYFLSRSLTMPRKGRVAAMP